ncbi:MAG TPA: adenosine deaminase [Candidatus Acidoferrales bacterium]|nr:adenosine deaminase [Candidatus Acidoferrales bacterium]
MTGPNHSANKSAGRAGASGDIPGGDPIQGRSGAAQNILSLIHALPKAELHLHLEGSIAPRTAVELAGRHGVGITEQDVSACYAPGDFTFFLNAFKWVTSFLRVPADYALITERLAEDLLAQNVVYAEVTLSVGVMLIRKQDALANFEAIRTAAAQFERSGLRLNWIFDAVRQFGVPAADEVARIAKQCVREGVAAFGIGGDETALPAADFKKIYESVGAAGLGRVIHAGEIGPATAIREAIDLLGVTRVGHGIAAMHDPALMDLLAARGVALEICPASNLRTGALARQLRVPTARMSQHPLPLFVRRGVPVTLSTDDPAMFETSLEGEYANATWLGLSAPELLRIAEASFEHAFLPQGEKQHHLQALRVAATGIE